MILKFMIIVAILPNINQFCTGNILLGKLTTRNHGNLVDKNQIQSEASSGNIFSNDKPIILTFDANVLEDNGNVIFDSPELAGNDSEKTMYVIGRFFVRILFRIGRRVFVTLQSMVPSPF